MLTIDGSAGGGQIVRTSLALAMITGTPVRIDNVRARRERPGLLRQHLTAVNAATAVAAATTDGATLGSQALIFRPGTVMPGDYHFAVGSAGSTGLVLQTVLPALLTAPGPSTLTLEGGTHNPAAPPFDFLARAFLPLIDRQGPRVTIRLDRPGFFPAGGGQVTVRVAPSPALRPFTLLERGAARRRAARAIVANLSPRIAERELGVVRDGLGFTADELSAEVVDGQARGPGNVVVIEVESEHVTEVFTSFGAIGVRAETVAERAVKEVRRYLAAGVPVGGHLADQLLLPLALAGGGAFRTVAPTAHTKTNIAVIHAFLGSRIHMTGGHDDVTVTVSAG